MFLERGIKMDYSYDYFEKKRERSYADYMDDNFDYEYSDELFYDGYREREEYDDYDDLDY